MIVAVRTTDSTKAKGRKAKNTTYPGRQERAEPVKELLTPITMTPTGEPAAGSM